MHVRPYPPPELWSAAFWNQCPARLCGGTRCELKRRHQGWDHAFERGEWIETWVEPVTIVFFTGEEGVSSLRQFG